jgi:hypothetical protein
MRAGLWSNSNHESIGGDRFIMVMDATGRVATVCVDRIKRAVLGYWLRAMVSTRRHPNQIAGFIVIPP